MSRWTLQTDMKEILRTPRLRTAICGSHEVLVFEPTTLGDEERHGDRLNHQANCAINTITLSIT